MTEDGPVKRTIGGIQTNLGDVFRDRIAESCRELGYEARKEKNFTGIDHIPASIGFGPIDVFVVDRKFKRFILVEAKDTDNPGILSNKVRTELNDFRKYVEKLERQTNWFRDRVESLKLEFGIDSNEVFAVAGVIVINLPRLWMFTTGEEYPVVTDRRFFDLLKRGGEFVTNP